MHFCTVGRKENSMLFGFNSSETNEILDHGVFQWVPTTFTVCLKKEYWGSIRQYEDMKSEYLDIKLKSLYIPDINEKQYPKLYPLLLNLLTTKIVPMYAKSVAIRKCKGNRLVASPVPNDATPSDEYKQLLYQWCMDEKELNIIIKCEEYNYNPKLNGEEVFDKEISSDYHIEGTEIEKITHVGIVYLDVDDNIEGGNLNLALHTHLKNTWKFKPKKASIILFPNMSHKIDEIGIWKRYSFSQNKNVNITRRILTFWFCDYDNDRPTTEYKQFANTQAFSLMSNQAESRIQIPLTIVVDPLNSTSNNNNNNNNDSNNNNNGVFTSNSYQAVFRIPILTASTILPLDIKHFNDLTGEMKKQLNATINSTIFGGNNSNDVSFPIEISSIIMDYCLMVNYNLLRNETMMQQNATQLRYFRREWTKGYGIAHRPMVAN